MMTMDEAIQMLQANNLNYDQIKPASFSAYSAAGSEINIAEPQCVWIGYLSFLRNDPAAVSTLFLEVWDYSSQSFQTMSIIGTCNFDNVPGIYRRILTQNNGDACAGFIGYYAKVQ